MLTELAVLGGATGVAAAGGWWYRHRALRNQIYRDLARQRDPMIAQHPPTLAVTADIPTVRAEFARDFLIRVEHFLAPACLAAIRQEALAAMPRLVRSFIPTHKQGGTLSYESIHACAPHCLGLYHSPAVHAWISAVVGEPVRPTADHDQSSCSILYYVEPGDHINWHYDHNFYCGRHFTFLISLVNEGIDGRLSQSKLWRKTADGEEVSIDTGENAAVLFEGAQVRHKASPVAAGERRVIFSMTFATDPRISVPKEIARRIKDTAFFGLRVLWD